jgi:ubiquinone/menaquinone biosynthesis C-methylase UbiE
MPPAISSDISAAFVATKGDDKSKSVPVRKWIRLRDTVRPGDSTVTGILTPARVPETCSTGSGPLCSMDGMTTAEDRAANRRHWDRVAAAYQSEHSGQLLGAGAAWGAWSVPDDEVGALGDVAGKAVLEAGCGAAGLSGALADRGAHCVGLDISGAQLRQARVQVGDRVRLVQGSADQLPFAPESFDLVFCDHGAAGWIDPELVIAESARVLRPGGRFAANTASPWRHVCAEPSSGDAVRTLYEPYFDRPRIGHDGGGAVFSRTYGEWVRALRRNGLLIEDLVELRPGPEDSTTFTWYVDHSWARRWPAEMLWVATKQG